MLTSIHMTKSLVVTKCISNSEVSDEKRKLNYKFMALEMRLSSSQNLATTHTHDR